MRSNAQARRQAGVATLIVSKVQDLESKSATPKGQCLYAYGTDSGTGGTTGRALRAHSFQVQVANAIGPVLVSPNVGAGRVGLF